jgi:predicted transcriptional regulator YdeE
MTQEFELNDPLASFATFTKTMKNKIVKGTRKHGDFTKWGTRTLIESLWKQFEQLNAALIDGNAEKSESECIDVANLAYMVAYSLKKRGVK